MIKLVATDLDGTLLRTDGTVSDRTRTALRAASDAGLLVAFVTGRPPRWLDPLMDETGHVGVAVAANGALLYDMATGETLEEHTLSPELTQDLVARLRAAFPDAGFAVEYGHAFAAEPGYVHDWDINPLLDRNGRPMEPPRIGSIEQIIDRGVVKLLVKDRTAEPDAFVAAATDLVATRATLTHSASYGLLEISAYGITKATGLAELARRTGLTAAEVVAIGDMPNDLAMLAWAGTSYAVANAHPSVVEVADETTVGNDDDAVARLIEALLAPSSTSS